MTTCCQKNVFIACEAQEKRIRELEAQLAERTAPAAGSDASVLAAQLATALEALGDLLGIIGSEGGYRKAPAQAKLRGARATYAELGGKP